MSRGGLPERIVCLSTETVEVLYALGEERRIAGISGFTVLPARARREKPKVSGFSSAKIDRILAVQPDLVLAFSDLQANMCADLIRAGVAVHVFNQRDIAGILDMVLTVGRLVGAVGRAEELVCQLRALLAAARAAGDARIARLGARPKVYFEEWDEPRICGIRWVSELIALAGGEDICARRARLPSAGERIIADDEEIIAAAPALILGSWCGKKLNPARMAERPGWAGIPAVARGHIVEIKSPHILSPGPAALELGLAEIGRALDRLAAC